MYTLSLLDCRILKNASETHMKTRDINSQKGERSTKKRDIAATLNVIALSLTDCHALKCERETHEETRDTRHAHIEGKETHEETWDTNYMYQFSITTLLSNDR